jgi:hypothetical protein
VAAKRRNKEMSALGTTARGGCARTREGTGAAATRVFLWAAALQVCRRGQFDVAQCGVNASGGGAPNALVNRAGQYDIAEYSHS